MPEAVNADNWRTAAGPLGETEWRVPAGPAVRALTGNGLSWSRAAPSSRARLTQTQPSSGSQPLPETDARSLVSARIRSRAVPLVAATGHAVTAAPGPTQTLPLPQGQDAELYAAIRLTLRRLMDEARNDEDRLRVNNAPCREEEPTAPRLLLAATCDRPPASSRDATQHAADAPGRTLDQSALESPWATS
jgi:hypothetical protein